MKVRIIDIPTTLSPKARCRCRAVASYEIHVDDDDYRRGAGFNLCSVCYRHLETELDGSLSDVESINAWLREGIGIVAA